VGLAGEPSKEVSIAKPFDRIRHSDILKAIGGSGRVLGWVWLRKCDVCRKLKDTGTVQHGKDGCYDGWICRECEDDLMR